MRPLPAIWFEALVVKDDAAMALEALAASGEFEPEIRDHPALILTELSELLQKFSELRRQYDAYWQPAWARPSPLRRSPHAAASEAVKKLERWEAAAQPVVLRLQALERERAELRGWTGVCNALAGRRLDFGLLARAGPLLAARIVMLKSGDILNPPATLTVCEFELDDQSGMLLLGPGAEMTLFCQQAVQMKARVLSIPAWAQGTVTTFREMIALRLGVIETEMQHARQQLERSYQQYGLSQALGDLLRLQWFGAQVGVFPESDLFVWITGWGSERGRLTDALEASGARVVAHFPPAPTECVAPMLLRNPGWAQPYELFSKALGMPGRSEVDPSRLLAWVVPLMFGYMFGDIGQGMLLVVLGGFLQRRHAEARILISCGVSAMLFGLLFGSIFSMHDQVTAQWLHPLDDPLTILAVPLAAGAVLLMAGMGLQALEAFWRGQFGTQLISDLGLMLLYGGALAGWFLPQAEWVVLMGGILYLFGHYRRTGKAMALLSGLGGLLESSLQLVANTLSFARVGAFALAHAGLSLAVTTIAAASGATASLWVLLIGNILVIAIEALAVTIQTTRLILFEFFLRFLRGTGRMFLPLPTPPYYLPGESHAT